MVSSNFLTALSTATSYINTPVVTLSVGPDGEHHKDLFVHEALLIHRSEFFANALKPDRFKEGSQRLVSMPEDEPDVVALYIQLLYRPDLFSANTSLTKEDLESTFTALAELYAFAEKVMDATTKGTVLKIFDTLTTNHLFPVEAAQIIYHGTLEGDLARAAFVQSFVRSGQEHSLDKIRDNGHADLFRDLAFALIKRHGKLPGDGPIARSRRSGGSSTCPPWKFRLSDSE